MGRYRQHLGILLSATLAAAVATCLALGPLLALQSLVVLGGLGFVVLSGMIVLLIAISSPEPDSPAIAAAASVAATATAILFVLSQLERDADGPSGGLALLLLGFLYLGLAIEWAILAAALVRARAVATALAFPATLAGLLAGWGLGMWLWSETNPARMLAEAEHIAAGQAYCIETHHGPVRRRADLTGFAAWVRGGHAWEFNAVLKLEDGGYWNWSHRRAGFDEVTPYARAGLHLDTDVRCIPQPDFADRLG